MPVNIKFGEVNNLADARYAASLGATFLGFNLSPLHPQYVSPDLLKEISGWAAGPAIVSEWETEPAEVISDTCRRLGIGYVELNNFNPAITAILKPDFCVIQNIVINENTGIADITNMLNQVNGLAMYFKFSFSSFAVQENFLSKPAHRLLLTDCCRDYPILLNFQFTPENLLPYIDEFKPFGINLKGSQDTQPGAKDSDDLFELFSILENLN